MQHAYQSSSITLFPLSSESRRQPGALLKEHRLQRGWTQQDLADELYRRCTEQGKASAGINADTVGRWERGKSTPCALYRRHLAQMFQVSEAQLGFSSVPSPVAASSPSLTPVAQTIATGELRRFMQLVKLFALDGDEQGRCWRYLQAECPTLMQAVEHDFQGEWSEILFSSHRLSVEGEHAQ